jgi:8-oxo-dGTP pyrophosphatase MutT (NUDIX family)
VTEPAPDAWEDRVGARVLLVDSRERVLLMRGVDPLDVPAGPWWITPGGGIDLGEGLAEGAARELAEETGLVLPAPALGEPVWVRTAEFGFNGRRYRQRETFFLLRVDTHEVDTSGFTELERSTLQGHRWWSLDELSRTEESVHPSRLGPELARLLREGRPAAPVDVGA